VSIVISFVGIDQCIFGHRLGDVHALPRWALIHEMMLKMESMSARSDDLKISFHFPIGDRLEVLTPLPFAGLHKVGGESLAKYLPCNGRRFHLFGRLMQRRRQRAERKVTVAVSFRFLLKF